MMMCAHTCILHAPYIPCIILSPISLLVGARAAYVGGSSIQYTNVSRELTSDIDHSGGANRKKNDGYKRK